VKVLKTICTPFYTFFFGTAVDDDAALRQQLLHYFRDYSIVYYVGSNLTSGVTLLHYKLFDTPQISATVNTNQQFS